MKAGLAAGLWISDVVRHIESRYHPSLKLDFDNPGLHIGFKRRTNRVMVALDPVQEVIAAAVNRKCQLLVVHHPILPSDNDKFIDDTNPAHRRVITALQHRLSVYCCHTPCDVSTDGINFAMAAKLGLRNICYIKVSGRDRKLKVVTFVPVTYREKMIRALTDAGAGTIGNYSACAFSVEGRGQFRGNDRSAPAIGRRNRVESVAETRLEMICDEIDQGRVAAALRAAHPYEEPAFEFYGLAEPYTDRGVGVIGTLPRPQKLSVVIRRLKSLLGIDLLRVNTLNQDRTIRTVAYCGGSGGGLLKDVIRQGADLYICGDLKLYHGQDSRDAGLVTIDAGHYHTERIFIELMADHLRRLRALRVLTFNRVTDYFINR